jgi:hypothetical protein
MCRYCSMPFVLGDGQRTAPCLDEVIPGEGYTPWNIDLLCDWCNIRKWNMTAKQAQLLADRIADATERAWNRKLANGQ